VSEQDVERLEAWLKTWDLHALVAGEVDYSLVDPDVIYEDAVLPDHAGEAYRGYEGMTHAARTWLGPFDEFSVELERVFSAGEDIVSLHRFRGRFRHTGMEFESPVAWRYTFRNGRIIRWRAYISAEDAIEAAAEECDSLPRGTARPRRALPK
jgi:ketosteroid isomerase-like protein